MTTKLSLEDWKKIKEMLQRKDRNISRIATYYGVSRQSIYAFCWRRNWIEKKQKKEKEGLFSRIKAVFSPKKAYK